MGKTMASKRFWIYSLEILVAGILLGAIRCYYQKLEPAEIILTLTAVIIGFYTYETYELRKATVDHTEIYTRPVLILHVEPNNRSKEVSLRLHNYGNSPAYNVEFRNTEFRLETPTLVQWRLKLENAGVIPPEGDIQLLLGDTENELRYDRVSSDELFKFINGAKISGESYSFRTTAVYDDILEHIWSCELGVSSNIGIIAKKPKRLRVKSNSRVNGR